MPDREPGTRPKLSGVPPRLSRARRRKRARRSQRLVGALAALLAVSLTLVVVINSAGHEQGYLRTHHVVGATGPSEPQPRRGPGRRSIIAREVRTDRRILAYTGYIRTGVPRRRDIALTFDDGPGPFTPRILAVLEHLHAKATFFEIGRQVRADPHITARLARAGMAIGDHTQDHPPLAELSPNEQAAEIDEAARAIAAAGAPKPLLFRPPYGSFDSATLALLRARDMLMAFWTVDTSDYAQPGVQRIIYTALSGARPGAIILFHDGGGNRSQTLAALPRIIERLHQRGYRLVSIPELLEDDPPPAGQSSPQPIAGD
jgi:peptidoglycan-N-acetylglucosamine deacetylase